jgi:hypothetical protein
MHSKSTQRVTGASLDGKILGACTHVYPDSGQDLGSMRYARTIRG